MKYTICEDIVYSEAGNKINILSLESDDNVYTLKGVASVMFKFLVDGFEKDNIIEKIEQEFEVETAVVTKDLEQLINSLINNKIIKEVN